MASYLSHCSVNCITLNWPTNTYNSGSAQTRTYAWITEKNSLYNCDALWLVASLANIEWLCYVIKGLVAKITFKPWHAKYQGRISVNKNIIAQFMLVVVTTVPMITYPASAAAFFVCQLSLCEWIWVKHNINTDSPAC